jgi:hypothetical protein
MAKRSAGEALHHAADDEGLGEGVAGGSEVADVVVGEVVDGLAPVPAHAAGVRGHRHLQLEALRPEGVVVVGAVQREGVDDLARVRGIGHRPRRRRHRPLHVVGDHDDLHAQLAHRVGGFLDGLLRSVDRDHRGGGDAGTIGREHLRVHPVHRARAGAAQLLVGIAHVEETQGGVEQAEVDAEVVQPLVEEARDHGGGAVEGIGGLAPPGGPVLPPVSPLLAAPLVPAGLRLLLHEMVGHRRARHLPEIVEEDRHRLQPVAVAVDDGMVEPGADGGGLGVFRVSHAGSSRGVHVCGRRRPAISVPAVVSLPRGQVKARDRAPTLAAPVAIDTGGGPVV